MSELPNSAHEPIAPAGLSQAAKEIIAANKPGHNTPTTLGVIALDAISTELSRKEAEKQQKATLQQKIDTLAEQVCTGLKVGLDSDGAVAIASYAGNFKVEPKDDNPNELAIYYYQNGSRSTSLNAEGLHIKGELAVPAELQITSLNCTGNRISKITELPDSLELLKSDTYKLTEQLLTLPQNLVILSCYINNLAQIATLQLNPFNLSCEDNNLTELPPLPQSLGEFKFINNPLNNETQATLSRWPT
jgi:hypothetical protein